MPRREMPLEEIRLAIIEGADDPFQRSLSVPWYDALVFQALPDTPLGNALRDVMESQGCLGGGRFVPDHIVEKLRALGNDPEEEAAKTFGLR